MKWPWQRRSAGDDTQDGATSGTYKPAGWLTHAFGGGRTAAGQFVGPDTAMRLSAVLACVQVLSQDLAALPIILYRRQKGGGKVRATEHPAYRLVHDRPNRRQTPYEFKRDQTAVMLLEGNAYQAKIRGRDMRVTELVPVNPRTTTVKVWRDGFNAQAFYDCRPTGSGETVTVPDYDMMHLREFSIDGLVGVSRIRWQAEMLGTALAMQEHGATFFANSANPGGVLQHPGSLSEAAAQRIRGDWERLHRGSDRSHKIAVLFEGMEFKPIGVPNKDAQWIEGRKLSRSEIASIFRVPPHKIGDLERATFSNIEHQSLDYVSDALVPLATLWEQRLNEGLLFEDERDEFFFEVLFDALLRGDMKSRAEAYAAYWNIGALSTNEIRERENMNPVPGGDVRWVPMNMQPADGSQVQGGSDNEASANV